MSSTITRAVKAAVRSPLIKKVVPKTAVPALKAKAGKLSTSSAGKESSLAKAALPKMVPAVDRWAPKPRPVAHITNLHHTGSDFYDLSRQTRAHLEFSLLDDKVTQYSARLPLDKRHDKPNVASFPYDMSKKHRAVPFPPKTKGKFYLHESPLSPLLSEIRFRVLKSPKASFVSPDAHDLKALNGLPWSIPLFAMYNNTDLHAFAKHLVKARQITTATMEKVKYSQENSLWKSQPSSSNVIVYSLMQEFPLALQALNQTVWLLGTDEKLQPISLEGMFAVYNPVPPAEGQPLKEWINRFHGQVICRFELSKLYEHEDIPTIVLRVIRIVDIEENKFKESQKPQDIDSIPAPIEKRLVQWPRSKIHPRGPMTWDNTTPVGKTLLKVLDGDNAPVLSELEEEIARKQIEEQEEMERRREAEAERNALEEETK